MLEQVIRAFCVMLILATGNSLAAEDRKVFIIPAERAARTAHQSEAPFWTPTSENISSLESKLSSFLDANPPMHDEKVTAPLSYGRQYIGVTRDGRKLIYLNALCPSFMPHVAPKRLEEEMVIVDDGGSCFFQVYFDPENSQFIDLRYNGAA